MMQSKAARGERCSQQVVTRKRQGPTLERWEPLCEDVPKQGSGQRTLRSADNRLRGGVEVRKGTKNGVCHPIPIVTAKACEVM